METKNIGAKAKESLKQGRSRIRKIRDFLESPKGKKIFLWIFQIAVALGFGAVVAIYFFQTVTMQESAMEPTLVTGEKYLVNRMIYKTGEPQRGDIIVFKTSGSDDAAVHIRRVIGLPGETIEIRKGKIYIDGDLYDEGGAYPEIANPGQASGGVTLGSGEYFVLGDNRNDSEDSRHADIGVVKSKYIEGKLWFVLSPRDKFGFLKG